MSINGRDQLSFESGAVRLDDGRLFIPSRDALDNWLLEIPASYRCLGSHYEILYLLDGDHFVLVHYDGEKIGCPPRAKQITHDEALEWLIAGMFHIPDVLLPKASWVADPTGLRTMLNANPSLVQKLQAVWRPFQPDRVDDLSGLRDFLARYYAISCERVQSLSFPQVDYALDALVSETEASQAACDPALENSVDDLEREPADSLEEAIAVIGEPLSQRAQEILEAMLLLEALDADHLVGMPVIVEQANGPNADPNAFKKIMVPLKKRGLVMSRKGSQGGYWLTETGKATAEEIVQHQTSRRN
jgi:predicted transcriptional regulator